MCINGACTASPVAPVTECPFGDDSASEFINDVPTKMECPSYFTYLQSKKLSILTFCESARGKSSCCKSCSGSLSFLVLIKSRDNLKTKEINLRLC